MTPKSLIVRGYEIPVATPSNVWFYGLWIGIPAFTVVLSILFAHSAVRASVIWVLIALGVFHLRNVVVRKEADAGLHDDLYGPHLMRMHQREFNKRLPWFRKALIASVMLTTVVGVVLNAAGINMSTVVPKAVRPVSTNV